MSLVHKIVGGGVLSVVILIVYFALALYGAIYHAEESRLGMALERIAATAAVSIDGDAHRTILRAADQSQPAFLAIRDYLAKVRLANRLPKEDQIYTFQVRSDDELAFAVMLQAETFVGDVYRVVPENRAAVFRALRQLVPSHTKVYEDKHGVWVSAYAPILDRQGQLAGLLEVDYPVDELLMALRRQIRGVLALSLIGLLLSALANVLFARSIGRALKQIRHAVSEIQHERYDVRIPGERSDELGLVARQINHMAETLSERFYMMRYLPQHTIDAVRQRSRRISTLSTERRYGAVLFSDIRDYTALANAISGEDLVAMLNHYIRRQAEVIGQHGGVIDKFMGDAVLALFWGDDAASSAIAAAKKLREAIADLNTAGVVKRPVHTGVGISVGDIVLGEIGSEGRRERTPLGSVVNKASRLASHAGGQEILVCQAVQAAVGDKHTFARSAQVALKGFAEPELVYWVP